MANTEQPRNVLRLYMYQPLIEWPKDQEEKEWQRRLTKTLEQKIWFSPLSGLNDPFERNFNLVSNPEFVQQTPDLLQMHLDFIKEEQPDITPAEFLTMLNSADFRKAYEQLSRSLIRTMFSEHGVACFTNDPSNIPMWAHYANRHRGYCIIFDFDFSVIGKATGLLPENETQYFNDVVAGKEIVTYNYDQGPIIFVFTKVRYAKTPQIVRIEELYPLQDDPYRSTKYLANKTLGIKCHQWQYENEYRLVANANSAEINSNFNLPDCLKVTGIIIGTGVTNAETDIFDQVCNQHRCPLYAAHYSETEYKIDHTLLKNYPVTELV